MNNKIKILNILMLKKEEYEKEKRGYTTCASYNHSYNATFSSN